MNTRLYQLIQLHLLVMSRMYQKLRIFYKTKVGYGVFRYILIVRWIIFKLNNFQIK
jgi:hypothetical protein